MLARLESSHHGKNVPIEWSEAFARLLNETYKSECKKFESYFDVYAKSYEEELLVIISFISEKDEAQSPISCFLSCEKKHIETPEKFLTTQKNYIDISGLLFDEIFATEDWNEFEVSWQEVQHKNESYFYKISRENVILTLEANRLLGEDFEE